MQGDAVDPRSCSKIQQAIKKDTRAWTAYLNDFLRRQTGAEIHRLMHHKDYDMAEAFCY